MSRISTLTIKLACGVSIFAIAGSICWTGGSHQAQAGSLRANKTMARAGVSRASGPKRGFEAKSRANTRFAVPRRTLQAKTLSRARRLNKATSSRRIKNTAPAVGNSRLSIVGADSRIQKLGKSASKPVFPRNSGRVLKSKNDAIAKNETNRTANIRPLHDRVLMKGNKINQNAGKSTRGVKLEGKPVVRHLDLTVTKSSLPSLKGSKILQNRKPGRESSAALDLPQKFLVFEDRRGEGGLPTGKHQHKPVSVVKPKENKAASGAALLTTNLRANLDGVGNPSGTSDSRSAGEYNFTQHRTLGLDRTGPDSAAGPRERRSSLPIIPNSASLGISNVMLGRSKVTYTYVVTNEGDALGPGAEDQARNTLTGLSRDKNLNRNGISTGALINARAQQAGGGKDGRTSRPRIQGVFMGGCVDCDDEKGQTFKWKIHSAFNSPLNRENESRTKEKGGSHISRFGNYRPQFYFRAIDETNNAAGTEENPGYYNSGFYLRPHYQLGDDAGHKSVLTDVSKTSRSAVVSKPKLFILDEPTAKQAEGHGDAINTLSRQGGASRSGKRPANLRGTTATHGGKGVVTGDNIPTIGMLSGTTSGKEFEIDSYDFGRETTLNPERQRIEFLRLLGLPVRPAGSSSTAPFGHTIGLGHEHQNPTDSTGAASSQPSFGAGLAQPLFEGNSDSSAGIRMQLGRVVVDSDHNEGTSDNANVAFQFNPDTLSRTKSNTSAGTDRARFSEVVLATTPFESIETAHVLPFIAEGDKNSEKEGKPLLIIAEDVEGESGLPPGKRQHKPVSVVKPATSCPNPGDYPPGC